MLIRLSVPVTLAFVNLATGGALEGKVSGMQPDSIESKITGISRGAVVFLEPIPAQTFHSSRTFRISEYNDEFRPRILVVPRGATVQFDNEDPGVTHNVQWSDISGDKRFAHNPGTWASGKVRSYRFGHPGIVPLSCYLHPGMSAWIIVAPTSYYAAADASGQYSIATSQMVAIGWSSGVKAAHLKAKYSQFLGGLRSTSNRPHVLW